MILLRQRNFAQYGIRAAEIGDYAKQNNISVGEAKDILYKQAKEAGKYQYGTYAAGDKGAYKGSQLQAVKDSSGKNTTGIQGQTGSGMFTVGDKNKKSSGYSASKAASQHDANTKRDFIKKQQQQAFDKGQQSVGILGGAKNTWGNMSDNQKLAAGVGGAALLAGTGALIIRNRRKRKEAERELELERARNSRRR